MSESRKKKKKKKKKKKTSGKIKQMKIKEIKLMKNK